MGELDRARQALFITRAWISSAEVPKEGAGALPHPDGMVRAQQIGKPYEKSLREYTHAMIQANKYLAASAVILAMSSIFLRQGIGFAVAMG
jgi:hypothetical protein